MTNHDAAFLWESTVLRERRSNQTEAAIPFGPGWVTLREAHRATGVPIDTLRKWGRQGSVPSMVIETEAGLRRLVRLESVIDRAEHQGRSVPAAPERARPQTAPSGPDPETTPETAAGTAEATAASEAAPPAQGTPPEGSMIVPIEAWDRMLMQLGNLHEAGQQLADARERAARAETEAVFLRERLAELRMDPTPSAAAEDPGPGAPTGTPTAVPTEASVPTEPFWEYAVRRWRLRRGR